MRSVRLCLLALFLGVIPVFAHDDGDEHSHAAPAEDHAGTGAAWKVVEENMRAIEAAIEAKQYQAIHDLEAKVSSGLRYLEKNSPMVTGEKATRLSSALAQALRLADSVHHAADKSDMPMTRVQFRKLQAALKLVKAQYPAEALAP